MIEVLKLIGSALVAAAATLTSLYLKRKWEKQDKTEDKKNAMEEKIDSRQCGQSARVRTYDGKEYMPG